MGKKVRVFLGENDLARLASAKQCKRSDQDCFFCDLLDCHDVHENGSKKRIGLVRLFGKDISVYFIPQEGCWVPYPV